MRPLLFEAIRLKNFKFFWVFVFGYMACLTLTMWMGREMVLSMLGEGIPALSEMIFSSSRGVLVMASVSGVFEYFLAFIVISLLVQEKELGTLKQHVIEGLSFLDWTIAKASTALILSLMATGILLLNSFAFLDPKVFSEHANDSLLIIGSVGLRIFGILTIATFIGCFVSHTMKGISAYILFVETIFSAVLARTIEMDLSGYLPYQVMSGLVPVPWAGLNAGVTGLTGELEPVSGNPALAVFYLALLWFSVYFVMKRADTVDSSG